LRVFLRKMRTHKLAANLRNWRSKRPIADELARNSAFASMGQAYQLALSGLLSILLARQLGVEAMGMYVATQALVGLVYVFTRLGLDVPAKRETSRDITRMRPYFGSALAVYLTVSMPLSLILALAAGKLLGIGSVPVIVLMALFVNTSGLVGLYRAAFHALNMFDISARVTVATHTAYVLIVALVLWFYPDLVIVLAVMVIAQLGILLIHVLVMKNIGYGFRPVWDIRLWRRIIIDGIPVMLASSGEYVNLRSDSIIIGAMLGVTVAGIYGVAYSFYLMLAIIVYLPSVGVFPTLARFSANHGLKAYRVFTNKLSLIFLGFSSLVAVGMYLLAPLLLVFLYGDEYQSSIIPLRILIIGLPFVALNRLMVQVLNASDLQSWTFRATAIGATFNVLVNLILIPRFGIVAAAYTTIITEALVWVVAVLGLRWAIARASTPSSSSTIG